MSVIRAMISMMVPIISMLFIIMAVMLFPSAVMMDRPVIFMVVIMIMYVVTTVTWVIMLAYQMLSGDEEEAKDRTQDAFLQAFRKIKQFKGKSSFYTWLYRIVVNKCIDARRRKQRWKKIFRPWRFDKDKEDEYSTSLEEYPDANKNSDPLSTASRKQLQQDVKGAMNILSEKQRTIFELKVFHEMTIVEISEMMGLAQGTVKTHLFRATRAIQKQLGKWADV